MTIISCVDGGGTRVLAIEDDREENSLNIDEKFEPDLIYERQLEEWHRRIIERDMATDENRGVIAMMKIIEGLYRSAETGSLVDLS